MWYATWIYERLFILDANLKRVLLIIFVVAVCWSGRRYVFFYEQSNNQPRRGSSYCDFFNIILDNSFASLSSGQNLDYLLFHEILLLPFISFQEKSIILLIFDKINCSFKNKKDLSTSPNLVNYLTGLCFIYSSFLQSIKQSKQTRQTETIIFLTWFFFKIFFCFSPRVTQFWAVQLAGKLFSFTPSCCISSYSPWFTNSPGRRAASAKNPTTALFGVYQRFMLFHMSRFHHGVGACDGGKGPGAKPLCPFIF